MKLYAFGVSTIKALYNERDFTTKKRSLTNLTKKPRRCRQSKWIERT